MYRNFEYQTLLNSLLVLYKHSKIMCETRNCFQLLNFWK